MTQPLPPDAPEPSPPAPAPFAAGFSPRTGDVKHSVTGIYNTIPAAAPFKDDALLALALGPANLASASPRPAEHAPSLALDRHPQAARLRERAAERPPGALADVLWKELVRLEHALKVPQGESLSSARGMPVAYFARRRTVAQLHRLREAGARLPRYWFKLFEMEGAEAQVVCEKLGHLAAREAIRGLNAAAAIRLLKPLGDTFAARATEEARGGGRPYHCEALSALIRERLTLAAGSHSRSLAAALGIHVVASAHASLSEDERWCLSSVARSSLPQSLAKAKVCPLSAEERPSVAALIEHATNEAAAQMGP